MIILSLPLSFSLSAQSFHIVFAQCSASEAAAEEKWYCECADDDVSGWLIHVRLSLMTNRGLLTTNPIRGLQLRFSSSREYRLESLKGNAQNSGVNLSLGGE